MKIAFGWCSELERRVEIRDLGTPDFASRGVVCLSFAITLALQESLLCSNCIRSIYFLVGRYQN